MNNQKIHILTDSCCDMPPEMAAKHNIEIIGVNITVGDKTYTEMHDLNTDEFWELLETTEQIPVTAQITPVRFFERFEQALARGVTHLLVVTMNSKGSGTNSSCHIARQMFDEEHPYAMRIEVLDGRNYSMIFGQAVLKAALLREQGVDFDDIVAQCDDMLHRNEAVIVIYTLKHLRKSGRIKGGAAFVGEALGLKPIIYAADTELNVTAKARGEKNVMPMLMDYLGRYIRDPQNQHMYVAHGKVPEKDIETLEKLVLEKYKPRSLERIKLGASVTINTGTKVLGVIFLGEKRD